MQKRHENRNIYFRGLPITSRDYFTSYIECWYPVEAKMDVLEIGCGEGGDLLPFSEIGCNTVGVDLAESRIKDAKTFFNEPHTKGEFIASDIFNLKKLGQSFDIIICYDIFEHTTEEELFLSNLNKYLKPQGIVFMPSLAWQMPSGGYQQVRRNRILSHLPLIHLFPTSIYRLLLKIFRADVDCIKELSAIKKTSVSVGLFERLIKKISLNILNRQPRFINPHYKIKLGLPPHRLSKMISGIPYLRNFAGTSCFYISKEKKQTNNKISLSFS